MTSDLAFWPALALAGIGAFTDIRERRLPNWLCLMMAVAGLVGVAFTNGFEALPWSLLHAIIALAAGMALFATGIVGGGDAKFYAGAACSVPAISLEGPVALLGWTSVAGLLVLAIMLVWRRFRSSKETSALLKGWEVPYGVAIAGGLWLTLLPELGASF